MARQGEFNTWEVLLDSVLNMGLRSVNISSDPILEVQTSGAAAFAWQSVQAVLVVSWDTKKKKHVYMKKGRITAACVGITKDLLASSTKSM